MAWNAIKCFMAHAPFERWHDLEARTRRAGIRPQMELSGAGCLSHEPWAHSGCFSLDVSNPLLQSSVLGESANHTQIHYFTQGNHNTLYVNLQNLESVF